MNDADPVSFDGLTRSTYPQLTANVTTPGRPLTEQMMRDAMERWLNAEPQPCGSPNNPHFVSNSALKRGGLTSCANCLNPVWLGEP